MGGVFQLPGLYKVRTYNRLKPYPFLIRFLTKSRLEIFWRGKQIQIAFQTKAPVEIFSRRKPYKVAFYNVLLYCE
jgi:hypothetical protein